MRIAQKEQHWYELRGEQAYPCYDLPKVSGNGVKQPTIVDARKMGLLPSVTNVINILDKPAVNNWRVGQAIIAALTLPRKEGEKDDDFAARVVVDMDDVSNKAKDFGTLIHDQAISWLQTGEKGSMWPFLEGFPDAIKAYSFVDLEQVVHSAALGIAGRLDYAGMRDPLLGPVRPCVIDFKTQGVRNGKPVFYEEWGLQLAAYGECRFPLAMATGEIDLVSVVIPSKEPGPVSVKVWDNPVELLRMFSRCVDLWCYLKSYDPRKDIRPSSV